MKNLLIVLAVIVIWYFINRIRYSKIKQVSVIELKEHLDSKDKENLFVDVRTLEEFKANKIKGFVNIPLNQINKRLKELPKEKKIILCCQSGGRSTSASRFLYKAGYENVINVKGGMSAWMRHNK